MRKASGVFLGFKIVCLVSTAVFMIYAVYDMMNTGISGRLLFDIVFTFFCLLQAFLNSVRYCRFSTKYMDSYEIITLNRISSFI